MSGRRRETTSLLDPDPPAPDPGRPGAELAKPGKILTRAAGPVLQFLGRTEVAHYLGMKSIRSLAGVDLPPHDVEIGDRKGWMPATIDRWKASRPGKGRRGARMGRTRAGNAA